MGFIETMRDSIGDAELLEVTKKTPRSHQLFENFGMACLSGVLL